MINPARTLFNTLLFLLAVNCLFAQKQLKSRLPDTGQTGSFTATPGEDSDSTINPPSYTDNGDGTITDNITGLMWQKTDGGEMTFENAATYCNDLVLSGYSDWRLPTGIELFSLNNYDNQNPALNTLCFTKTLAGYWWTCEVQSGDASKVWVVNAGGGIGAHPKSETVSAGGIKKFHARAVRNLLSAEFTAAHFSDNDNETIADNYTGLIWQKIQPASTMTWEEALAYADGMTLAGKSDWRLPNIRELQSLNDVQLSRPSFNKAFFTNMGSGNYWSSTTLQNTAARAWDINIDYGIVSYNDKTLKQNVLLVRGGLDNAGLNVSEVMIPGAEYEMGDHFGFVDPAHPSDELPIHSVIVDSFYLAKTETTNEQYLAFLNASLQKGLIEVRNNMVYPVGGTDLYYYTNQFASFYSIGYDGKVFSMADFRGKHPVVGVMWPGAAAFCNWLSLQNGLDECYTLKTWECDFAKNGYRLPTEAEWEYAGRGGQKDPYYNYPWGNDQDVTKANWPKSGDPYEGTAESTYPHTTPVGFYDGRLHQKSEYNWPGSAASYQTSNGDNAFGLYDMAGNVWEFVNDWYGQNYYSIDPKVNPTGPASGFIMPDGKAYRGMRGGNWYNGYSTTAINDGHSRVSNRNLSYYRGPQDPNHPWYHVGFRVARKYPGNATGIDIGQEYDPNGVLGFRNYPNPFNSTATIRVDLGRSESVTLNIYNSFGQLVAAIENQKLNEGSHVYRWNADSYPSGIYSCILQIDNQVLTNRMVLIK
jgi:formylglycine-generating enzyme required for sulfatase activity